jgi:glutamate-1-semialdehyde 2,1-aminomutase
MDEVARYRSRTPRSEAVHRRALATIPLGVESNFRFFDPYPIFIDHAAGTRMWDVDGHEYLDFAMCMGSLMVGHAHPSIVRAIERQGPNGIMYGMPNTLMIELAEELTSRFAIDRIRFTNSGTEATMHAMRVARGFTGRDRILKFEGAYHGAHDAALVTVKPPSGESGDASAPLSVPVGRGIPSAVVALTVAATFNNIESVVGAFARHKGEIAALILEPVMMNVGVVEPAQGFLQALRDVCTREGALLIFDEVKTGSKLAAGGAAEYYGVTPDLITIAKAFAGGGPVGAFGGRQDVMGLIERFEVFHAGTYNAGPLAVAAALAGLRDVLTPDVFPRVRALNGRLVDGYNDIIQRTGLDAHATGVGANGCIYFTRHPVRNYRDFLEYADAAQFWRYYFAMMNRGVIPTAQHHDEQWTISAVHTEADIEAHLAVFDEVAKTMATSRATSGAS